MTVLVELTDANDDLHLCSLMHIRYFTCFIWIFHLLNLNLYYSECLLPSIKWGFSPNSCFLYKKTINRKWGTMGKWRRKIMSQRVCFSFMFFEFLMFTLNSNRSNGSFNSKFTSEGEDWVWYGSSARGWKIQWPTCLMDFVVSFPLFIICAWWILY